MWNVPYTVALLEPARALSSLMPWGLAALMTAAWLTLPSPQRRFEPPTIFVAGDLCRQERGRG
ncbi:MAG TPA: hypothetical protein VI755_02880 [Anaerolineales bacterium]|nr:hypothetical protein [Anaerolineales bacterium]